jgi:AMP-binding enzyme
VGREVDRYRLAGKGVPLLLKVVHGLFDRLVFSKVRDVFGGRIKFFISGAAPLNRDIAEWFHAAGLLILEGYGLTETAAGAFINRPDNYKLGTVGLVFDGTSVRIADDGEVQVQGPCVMDGYHNLPDKTAETLTEDGWLRTGDKGRLDDDGFLTITGRIKELFKTSGGKYVAPPGYTPPARTFCTRTIGRVSNSRYRVRLGGTSWAALRPGAPPVVWCSGRHQQRASRRCRPRPRRRCGRLDTDTRGVDVQWSENATADSFGKSLVFARCESRYATSVFSPLGVVSLDLTA